MEFAARLKKKFGMETVSYLSVRNLYIPAFIELARTYGPEKASQVFFRWGFQMGHDFMLELKRNAERIRMHDLHERKALARIAWYVFMGRRPEVSAWWERVGEEKVLFLRLIDDNNPLVRGVSLSLKVPLCAYAAGAYEGASQTVFTLQGEKYFVLAREIKCKAVGDPYCEIVLVDIPVESLDEVAPLISEKYPGFFKHISLDFSKRLRGLVTI